MPPLWSLALLFAAAAPFVVAGLENLVEKRWRNRTLAAIARAGLQPVDPRHDDPR